MKRLILALSLGVMVLVASKAVAFDVVTCNLTNQDIQISYTSWLPVFGTLCNAGSSFPNGVYKYIVPAHWILGENLYYGGCCVYDSTINIQGVDPENIYWTGTGDQCSSVSITIGERSSGLYAVINREVMDIGRRCSPYVK